MGCVASRIDKVERVQICKQRKRLMKQLVGFRAEFAEAQLAYLKALKNTGVTLRQFTESETLDLENSTADVFSRRPPPPPASPPQPLPPSPPPPPPLSPDLRKAEEGSQKEEEVAGGGEEEEEEEEEGSEESSVLSECEAPPSPPVLRSTWDSWGNSWYPFHGSSQYEAAAAVVEEDENWAETKTEFEEQGEEEIRVAVPEKVRAVGPAEDGDSSSAASWRGAEDATRAGAAMVLWRSKKTLEGVSKELDDHFLRASAGVREITVLMEFLPDNLRERNGKKGNTAKVFSALSWSWSSKSLQFPRDSFDSAGQPSEPCKPGAHCFTLKKLLEEEQKLYKDVKEEEVTKIEHEKKSSLLRRQEEENHEWSKTEKVRSSVESLEADLMRLQESIARTCSSILNLIDNELYPQMIAITSGLLQMWRTMYESHQAQYQISQLLNHLNENQKMDLSTAHHRQAAAQLETEVNRWYNSFCQVASSQQEYVRTLCRWIKLTDGLKDEHRQSLHSSVVRSLCEKWQFSLERLPDKAASEAIKGLCTAIHAIVLQQEEEHNLQRKYEKAERRLHKELESLADLEMKIAATIGEDGSSNNLSPKHPLSVKRTKTEALKKRVEAEKLTYFKSVQATKAMTLNNLKTTLPIVFRALSDFSKGSVEAIEGVFGNVRPEGEDGRDNESETVTEN